MGTDSGLYKLHIKLQQPKAERYRFRAKHSDEDGLKVFNCEEQLSHSNFCVWNFGKHHTCPEHLDLSLGTWPHVHIIDMTHTYICMYTQSNIVYIYIDAFLYCACQTFSYYKVQLPCQKETEMDRNGFNISWLLERKEPFHPLALPNLYEGRHSLLAQDVKSRQNKRCNRRHSCNHLYSKRTNIWWIMGLSCHSEAPSEPTQPSHT